MRQIFASTDRIFRLRTDIIEDINYADAAKSGHIISGESCRFPFSLIFRSGDSFW